MNLKHKMLRGKKKQTTKEYWKATNHRILLIVLGHTTIISRAPKKGKLSKMGV